MVGLKRCPAGPPLVPTLTGDGIVEWVAPEDVNLHFAEYLKLLLTRLKGDSWSSRVLMTMNNRRLVRYQAAVSTKEWIE